MYAYNLLACSPTCGNGKQTSIEGVYYYRSRVRGMPEDRRACIYWLALSKRVMILQPPQYLL